LEDIAIDDFHLDGDTVNRPSIADIAEPSAGNGPGVGINPYIATQDDFIDIVNRIGTPTCQDFTAYEVVN
jgi:hypothetical protein